MRVRIIVESDDFVHRAICLVDDMVLQPPAKREDAKQVLWHAYEMARMKLNEMREAGHLSSHDLGTPFG